MGDVSLRTPSPTILAASRGYKDANREKREAPTPHACMQGPIWKEPPNPQRQNSQAINLNVCQRPLEIVQTHVPTNAAQLMSGYSKCSKILTAITLQALKQVGQGKKKNLIPCKM